VSSANHEIAPTRAGWFDTEIDGFRVRVVPLGLACCAVELAWGMTLLRSVGAVHSGGRAAPDCHVLVVAGTVTHAIADDVRAAWEALPQPRAAVAFGACTISGGPYWDSYSVRPGLGGLIPAVVVVPGCPPGPDTVVAAVAKAVAALGPDRPAGRLEGGGAVD
jgi:NADH-quinone oxidoreductase subunit B